MSEPMTESPRIKVLIAEDLRSSRINIQNLLRHWGYDPVPCEDGLAARQALSEPDGPRVAILDWVMPGMTGPEVCKWIVEELGSFVYTILLTSKSEQGDLIEGLTAGAHAFITKPARPAELQTWIRVGLRMVDYEQELARKNRELGEYAREKEALAEKLALQLAEAGQCDALAGLGSGLGTEIRRTTGLLLDDLAALDRCWAQMQVDAPPAVVPYPGLHDDGQRSLDALRRGLERLLAVAGNLESFRHSATPPSAQRCRLNDVIQGAIQLCEASIGNTRLRFALDPHLPETTVSPEILQRTIAQYIIELCRGTLESSPGTMAVFTYLADGKIVLRMEGASADGSRVLRCAGLAADLEMLRQLGCQSQLEAIPGVGTRLSVTLPTTAPA